MRLVWWDPAGLGLVLMTWTLLLVAMVVIHDCVLVSWFAHRSLNGDWEFNSSGKWIWWIYLSLSALTFVSHCRAMLTNPGTLRGVVHEKGTRKCTKCTSWKPARAYHCRICGDCVFRMDHHCPWINNCVGFGNLKFFILFTCYVSLLSVYSLVLLAVGVFLWKLDGGPTNVLAVAGGVTVAIEAGFFLWFAGDFFTEQLESIESNTTLVETYKG